MPLQREQPRKLDHQRLSSDAENGPSINYKRDDHIDMPLQMRVPLKPAVSRGVLDQSPYLVKVEETLGQMRKQSMQYPGSAAEPEYSSQSMTNPAAEDTVNTSELNVHTLDSKTTF